MIAIAACSFLALAHMNSSSSTLDTIRRMLCQDDNVSAYVRTTGVVSGPQYAQEIVNQMGPPPIPSRRDPPSHVILCEEFLNRKEALAAGNPVKNEFLLKEDEAVCQDWSTPHVSLIEMFSSNIVSYVGQKYGVKYQHNCGKSKAESEDQHDWTTIQEGFPVSGLVLDNGAVNEDEVASLCRGCLLEHNEKTAQSTPSEENVNPNWFNRHNTHHCILYPGTSRPVINGKEETDMVALAEQREKAQTMPINSVLATIQDRLRLAAVEYEMENDVPDSVKDAFPSNPSVEHEDGVVIYLEDGSLPVEFKKYAQYVPLSAKTISVIVHPLCSTETFSTGESCLHHASNLTSYLGVMHPNAVTEMDVVTSTAAAFSRMILAKYLICPPGTTGCLLPALSKEEGTFAVVAESTHRANTFHYYDFVSGYEDFLQIAHISDNASDDVARAQASAFKNLDGVTMNDFVTETSLSGAASSSSTFSGSDTSASNADGSDTSPENLDGAETRVDAQDLDAFTNLGGYRDGCIELRGRLGTWEQDFDYSDLVGEKADQLRGSSAAAQKTTGRYEGIGAGVDEKIKNVSGFQGVSGDPMWREMEPECELDLLNKDGLCEVVATMKLSVIQFVGDEYTEEMVRSFWALLGLPNPSDSGKQPLEEGEPLERYRRTVECEIQRITFDVVFTPNESLVHTIVADPIPPPDPIIRYVPVPAPVVPMTYPPVAPVDAGANTYAGGNGYVGGTPAYTGANTYGGYGGNGGNYWWNQPYASGGTTWNTNVAVQGRGAPVAPSYNSQCSCVPFQQQYQQYQTVQPQGRQMIVAGMSPNMSYEQYCNQFNDFGRGLVDNINPNDVVVLRSGMAPHGACAGCATCGRRTKESQVMSQDELKAANDYMIRAVDEYRRRTRQLDMTQYDPSRSGKPNIHFLDVSSMTYSHPHAQASSPDNEHSRKLCQSQQMQTAPMYDSWNHLLYSNMRDLAAAEMGQAQGPGGLSSPFYQSAPQGSPYQNGVPFYP
jgi:hypothetical protein